MTCCPDGFSLTTNIVLAFRPFPRSLPNAHVNPWREEKDAKGLTPKEGLVEELTAFPCVRAHVSVGQSIKISVIGGLLRPKEEERNGSLIWG